MLIDFREPWVAVGQYAENLVKELERELTDQHVLWGKSVRPVAQRTDSDDVLFELDGEPSTYAVVHLTWSGEPEDNYRWPDTKLFSSLDEWIRDGMLPDHHEFVGEET